MLYQWDAVVDLVLIRPCCRGIAKQSQEIRNKKAPQSSPAVLLVYIFQLDLAAEEQPTDVWVVQQFVTRTGNRSFP